MLTEFELADEARIRRIASRSARTYIGYARQARLGGHRSLACYWLSQAKEARGRYAASLDWVRSPYC